MPVIHLCDDATPGGVTRVLERLSRLRGEHVVRQIRRGRPPGHMRAGVIVSHLSVSWRTLPMLAALRAANPRARLVHVEHSYTEAFAALNVARPRRFAALLRVAYALFGRVVAVSEAQGAWLVAAGHVRASRLTVIRPAVDLSAFAALPLPRARVRTIGAIGRLDRQKGLDVLVAAFRALPDAAIRLHIAGEGPERARLERLAAGDPRIRFLGHRDPVAAMAGMDAVAMPSRWEAFGLAGLEARAAGRPLLAARVDGLHDQIEAGAIPVDGTGVAAWTRALAALLHGGAPRDAIGTRAAALMSEREFAADWTALVDPRLAAGRRGRWEGRALRP